MTNFFHNLIPLWPWLQTLIMPETQGYIADFCFLTGVVSSVNDTQINIVPGVIDARTFLYDLVFNGLCRF